MWQAEERAALLESLRDHHPRPPEAPAALPASAGDTSAVDTAAPSGTSASDGTEVEAHAQPNGDAMGAGVSGSQAPADVAADGVRDPEGEADAARVAARAPAVDAPEPAEPPAASDHRQEEQVGHCVSRRFGEVCGRCLY